MLWLHWWHFWKVGAGNIQSLNFTLILTRDLKVDGCQSNLYVVVNQLLFLYKFYDFFSMRHSLMNQPGYNNLFQFMQHGSFLNLHKVIFTDGKYWKSQVNAFWYWFSVTKWSTFHYFMKSAPTPGNNVSFEILQMFDTRRYQKFSDIIFSSILILI